MVGWSGFDIGSFLKGQLVGDGGITSVSRIKDHMELWWIAPNGSVQDAYWYSTQQPNWKTVELAPPGSAHPSSGVAAVSRKPGHMEVWWVGQSGSIEGCYWYDNLNRWSRYQLAPEKSAAPGSAIYAQSRIPSVMNTWWLGPKGSIEGCYWVEGVSDRPWKRYQIGGDGSASLSSELTALSRISNSEEIWWQSPQGSIEGAYWYEGGTSWQRYQISPAGSSAIGAGMKAISRIPSVMNMWWIHPNGSIQGSYIVVNAAKGWTRYELAPPGSASVQGGLTAASRRPDTEEVWWIGPAGQVKDAYWYQDHNAWRFFDLAPAGSARINSKISSTTRIKRSMELWYASRDSVLQDKFWHDVPYFDFSIESIQCKTTRSRNKDTLHMAISVAVGSREPAKTSRTIGRHGEGTFNPQMVISGIPLADNDIAIFSYILINDGHSDDSVVQKGLEMAASKIAHEGASAAASVVKSAASAAAGAAVGAAIGTTVPVLGTIIGAGLGALTGALLSNLIDLISPNCDGPIGAAALYIDGSELRQKIESGQKYGRRDINPGTESPAGCGPTSDYNITWNVKMTPD